MAQEVVTFGDIVPSQLRVLPLATGAGRVARKTRREFLPIQGANFYSYNENPRIEFSISSSKDMLIPKEMYLRFTVRTLCLVGNPLQPVNNVQFNHAGAHGLFRRVQLTDRANRQIDVIDNYDVVATTITAVYDDKHSSEISGWAAGLGTNLKNAFATNLSSPTSFDSSTFQLNDGRVLSGTVRIDAGTVNVLGTNTQFTTELFVGDIIAFVKNGTIGFTASVTSITNSTTLAVNAAAPYTFAAAQTWKAIVVTHQQATQYNVDREITLRLKMGLFDMDTDLPLFLMDGLQLELELQDGARSLIFPPTGLISAGVSAEYRISEPRLITNLRTPSSEIRDQYLEMFQKGMLNYPFISYHSTTKPVSGAATGRQELDLPISKSSIRKVFFVCQSDVSRGTYNSTDYIPSNTYQSDTMRFLNAGLTEFHFKIGGMDYPNVPIRISDAYAADAFEELVNASNRAKDDTRVHQLDYDEWVAVKQGLVSSDNTQTADIYLDAVRRIYAVRFDTVEDDILSGVKTRGIGTDDHIVAVLTYNGQALKMQTVNSTQTEVSARNLYFMFEHARVLHISQRGILTLD